MCPVSFYSFLLNPPQALHHDRHAQSHHRSPRRRETQQPFLTPQRSWPLRGTGHLDWPSALNCVFRPPPLCPLDVWVALLCLLSRFLLSLQPCTSSLSALIPWFSLVVSRPPVHRWHPHSGLQIDPRPWIPGIHTHPCEVLTETPDGWAETYAKLRSCSPPTKLQLSLLLRMSVLFFPAGCLAAHLPVTLTALCVPRPHHVRQDIHADVSRLDRLLTNALTPVSLPRRGERRGAPQASPVWSLRALLRHRLRRLVASAHWNTRTCCEPSQSHLPHLAPSAQLNSDSQGPAPSGPRSLPGMLVLRPTHSSDASATPLFCSAGPKVTPSPQSLSTCSCYGQSGSHPQQTCDLLLLFIQAPENPPPRGSSQTACVNGHPEPRHCAPRPCRSALLGTQFHLTYCKVHGFSRALTWRPH